jgi:transposase
MQWQHDPDPRDVNQASQLGKSAKAPSKASLRSLVPHSQTLRLTTQLRQAASHRICFHFTPKHTSWLNQIEIWVSILVRKLLRRASFTSRQDLKARAEAFITYFNRTLAKSLSQ